MRFGAFAVAVALGSSQEPSAEARAAEIFIEACIAAAGDRADVADLALQRGWPHIDFVSRYPEALWADRYETPSGNLILARTPRSELPSSQPSELPPSAPRLIAWSPEAKECSIVLQWQPGTWRDVAVLLDASPLLVPYPEDRQPEGLPGQVLRNYNLAARDSSSVTIPRVSILENGEGLLKIVIRRYPRRNTGS
jgi:hypothetical protein